MPNSKRDSNRTTQSSKNITKAVIPPRDLTTRIRRPQADNLDKCGEAVNEQPPQEVDDDFSFENIDWGGSDSLFAETHGSNDNGADSTIAMIGRDEGTTFITRHHDDPQYSPITPEENEPPEIEAPPQEDKSQGGKKRNRAKGIALGAGMVLAAILAAVFVVPAIQNYLESQIDVPYSVSFVDANTGKAVADPLEQTAKNHENVTVSAQPIDGYRLSGGAVTKDDETLESSDDAESFDITLEAGVSQNAIFSYKKVVSYTVNYVDADGKSITETKTVKNKLSGKKVSETAPTIDGYTLNGDSKQTLKLTNSKKKNVITFTYTKNPDPEPVYTAPAYSYTPATNSGSSNRSSGGSSSIGKWGGSK